jgi:hypothetical protein
VDAVRAVVEWMPSEASPLTVQIYLFLGLEGQKAWRALLRVVQFRLTLDTLEEALRSTPLILEEALRSTPLLGWSRAPASLV